MTAKPTSGVLPSNRWRIDCSKAAPTERSLNTVMVHGDFIELMILSINSGPRKALGGSNTA